MESKLTKMEKRQYKKSVLEYEDVQNAILYAEERSLKKGRLEGVEQGREQGREEGREEGQRLLIKRMLSNGLDAETIAAATGIPLEEILTLSKS